jgi:FG-GAP-like repeat
MTPTTSFLPGEVVPSFLKGLGGGNYSQTGVVTPIAFSSAVTAESIGDMNGDGRADLVLWDQPLVNPSTRVSANYLKGDADGTFTAGGSTSFSAAEAGFSVTRTPDVIGDFNNDGNPDILTAAWTVGDNSQAVEWVFVSAKGCTTLSAGVFIGAHGDVLSLETVPGADFNSDGNLDLAGALHTETLAGTTNTTNVVVIYGHGDGTFASSVNVPGTSGAFDVSIAELNGDGIMDLDVDIPPNYVPFYGDGAGNFSTTPP